MVKDVNKESMHPVAGVYLGATAAKIKKSATEDLLVVSFAPGSRTAATFTQNAFCAAPVTLAKQHLLVQSTEALIINSGNANAGTGKKGLQDALQTCQWVATELGIAPEAVLPFSTGVIGENLPMQKMALGIPNAIANQSITGWDAAAKAIMTTDTCAKKLSCQFDIDGHLITLNGIAKGSGMIHPNMATMLGFAATDAKISQACLDKALKDAVTVSFNRITVDGDTSTNDACTLTATQLADMPEITDTESEAYRCFYQAVEAMMIALAQMIIRDGEGATKFVTVTVEKGASSNECLQVAHAVALSPLVKTALFASDPNWGRILAAVGRSGLVNFDIDALQIYLGDILLVENGGRADSYTEAAGQAVMNETDITIRIILNRGEVAETVWTTDFSYDYVRINAEYRS